MKHSLKILLLFWAAASLAGCFAVNRSIDNWGDTLDQDVELNSFASGYGLFVCPYAARIALENGISKMADVEYTIFFGTVLPYPLFNSPGVGLVCLTQVSGFAKEGEAGKKKPEPPESAGEGGKKTIFDLGTSNPPKSHSDRLRKTTEEDE